MSSIDPGLVTLASTTISALATIVNTWMGLKADKVKPNRKEAERYRDEARLARNTAVGFAVTALIAAFGLTYWLWSVQRTILVPRLTAFSTLQPNVWHPAKADGLVVAYIQYPGPDSNNRGASYGRGHIAGRVDPNSGSAVNDHDTFVSRCTANAEAYVSSIEYCSISFPVQKGSRFRVDTSLYGKGGVAVVKFASLELHPSREGR
jgi:hypothetical protein